MDYPTYKKHSDEYHRKFARYNKFKIAFLKKYFRYFHRLEVIGRENIPDGPAILAPNHPGGMELDIFAVSYCAHEKREPVTLIVEDWHFINHAWGRWYVGSGLPLGVPGGISHEYTDPYLKDGGENYPGLICIFPEGKVPHLRDRHSVFNYFPGVVRLALYYKVPVLPVALINFAEACPVIKIFNHDKKPDDILCLPFAFPLKLKIEIGKPIYLNDYYDKQLGKAEEFWIANEIIRPAHIKIREKYYKIDVKPVDTIMAPPV